ncbi:hypothetical protein [Plantactinospora sonchi]|uniref:Uncharacterized protein n=1 Tax=Plantactinospora sonchi TaxID=1544735 RepID=A0ABU7RSP6_9ACTN
MTAQPVDPAAPRACSPDPLRRRPVTRTVGDRYASAAELVPAKPSDGRPSVRGVGR